MTFSCLFLCLCRCYITDTTQSTELTALFHSLSVVVALYCYKRLLPIVLRRDDTLDMLPTKDMAVFRRPGFCDISRGEMTDRPCSFSMMLWLIRVDNCAEVKIQVEQLFLKFSCMHSIFPVSVHTWLFEAVRFCRAPQHASRVASFLLKPSRDRYICSDFWLYNKSTPVGSSFSMAGKLNSW